eukprot:CAMPEP_0118672834 /NCGR_PEP_ID=MMETSP0785-20121206/22758_1 /TAXON_ID=91992 /ORGANISM="Bolidomonas pacifica, Strain CCMP 1866" /LENGTH=1922 /DNA_ID=CAMNT_0006567835 /DNA_START=164 /DNA_END=5931 /DNA_ORIENTATION=+
MDVDTPPIPPSPPKRVKLNPIHTVDPSIDQDHLSAYFASHLSKLSILLSKTNLYNCHKNATIIYKLLNKLQEGKVQLEPLLLMRMVKLFVELAHETTDGPTTIVTIVTGTSACSSYLSSPTPPNPPLPTIQKFNIRAPCSHEDKANERSVARDMRRRARELHQPLPPLPNLPPKPPLLHTLEATLRGLSAPEPLPRRNRDITQRERQPENSEQHQGEAADFISSARMFFPQFEDFSSNEIMDFVSHDLSQFHSCICFRAQITLVRFLPTYASPDFYTLAIPQWSKLWCGVDTCPEWDCNWLSMMCRARKHAPKDFDWGPIQKQVYSRAILFLRIPVGSTGDSAFLSQNQPLRSINYKFKLLSGQTADFGSMVSKLCKLMTFWLGNGQKDDRGISKGTESFLKFWEYISPYFNPSNYGNWTVHLGVTLQYTCRLLAMRVGIELGKEELIEKGEADKASLIYYPVTHLTPTELLHIVNTLLPLVYQTIYCKHPGVSHCGDVSLRNLSSICPRALTPPTLRFLSDALSPNAVNQTHQAPVALRSISTIVKLIIRTRSSQFFKHLPPILDLSLHGIDCNDDGKTQSAFMFFASLTEWLPIGMSKEDIVAQPKDDESFFDISTDPEWEAAAASLPPSSPLSSPPMEPSIDDNFPYEVAEASEYLESWALQVLDRIYAIFKSADPMMKKIKTGHAAHSSHSINARARQDEFSAQVSSYFCTLLMQSLPLRVFKKALSSVSTFLSASSYPNAFKQVANLCLACNTNDPELALEKLFPLMSVGIMSLSTPIATYRMRVICGMVKKSGMALLKYKDDLVELIGFALNSDDKKLRKAGNKLFRHTLASLFSTGLPVSRLIHDQPPGTPASPTKTPTGYVYDIDYREVSGPDVDFAVLLLKTFLVPAMNDMEETIAAGNDGSIEKWRRSTKILYYGVRGIIGNLNDRRGDKSDADMDDYGFTYENENFMDFSDEFGGDDDDDGDFDLQGGMDDSDENEGDGAVEAVRMDVDSVLGFKKPIMSLHPVERTVFQRWAKSSKDSQEFLAPLKFQLTELVGKCLAAVSASNEAEYEYQRDRKGAKELINCSQVLLLKRRPAKRNAFSSHHFVTKVDSERNTVVHEKAYAMSDANIRYNREYKDDDGFLFPGWSMSRNMMIMKVHVCKIDRIEKSLQEILLRIRKNAKIGDPTDSSTLASYNKLVDGLFGLTSHTNSEVSSCSLGVIGKLKGAYVKERIPRLIATMDLSDGSLEKKFGMPIAQHYGESPSEIIRLYEVVKGALLVLQQSIKRVALDRRVSYDFIKKFFKMEEMVVKRITEESKAVHLEVLMNSLWEAFRATYDFQMSPSTKPKIKVAHRECLEHLMVLLEGEGEWKRKLTIVWFLIFMVAEDEGKDLELATKLWNICCGLVESEMEGMPLQRAALGLLGRLVKVLDAKVVNDAKFREVVEGSLCDGNFCSKLVNGLAAAHKSKSTREQWSKGVGNMLKDSAARCGGTQAFPSLRDTLVSYTFRLKHVMLVQGLIGLLGSDVRGKAAELLLVKCKEMARMPPTEDQVNQHCAAAEVFGGVCKGLLGSYQGVENAEAAWKIMIPFLEDVLDIVQMKAIGDWSDGIRFGVHRVGVGETKKVLDMMVGKVAGSMWDGEEGFANSVKWMKLLSPLLIELSYVEPEVGLLERVVGGLSVEKGEAKRGESELRAKFFKYLSDMLLEKSLGAVCHPFKKCRTHISTLLMSLSGVTAANWTLGIEGDCDPVVEKFEDILLGDGATKVGLEGKKKCREMVCVFIFKCIHLGDVERYYAKIVVKLLPCLFSCLEVEEGAGEEDRKEEGNEEGVREGMSMTRQTIATLATACLLLHEGAEETRDEAIRVAGVACENKNWQVRQAACIFLGRFFSSHKFCLGEGGIGRIFDLICNLLGDERREVSYSAAAALTGMLAVMGE